MPDAHPGDVGDGVEGPRREDAGGEADLARPRPRLRLRGGDRGSRGPGPHHAGAGGRGHDEAAPHPRSRLRRMAAVMRWRTVQEPFQGSAFSDSRRARMLPTWNWSGSTPRVELLPGDRRRHGALPARARVE